MPVIGGVITPGGGGGGGGTPGAGLPTQDGHAGEWLRTTGAEPHWEDITEVALTYVGTSDNPITDEATTRPPSDGPVYWICAQGVEPANAINGDFIWTYGADTAITKADVGLGNVDNTSDLAKPVSTATAAALAGKITGTNVGAMIKLTQAQYDALKLSGQLVNTTVYLIVDAPATNRIANPGFETNLDGYNFVNCTGARVTSPVHSGSGALRITASSTSGVYFEVFPLIECEPGEQLHVEAWVRSAVTSRYCVLSVNFFPDTIPSNYIGNAEITGLNTTTGEYQLLSGECEVPDGANAASLVVTFTTSAVSEQHYADDLVVRTAT